MIPEVTVASETEGKADGEDRVAEPERRGAGERERNEVGRATRMTARSFSGAVPITVPAIGRLCTSSLKTTVTRVVPSTTWLFVRMIPPRSSTIPEPSPRPPPNVCVRTLTTDGRTRATASASDPVAASGAVPVTVELGSVTVTVCVAVDAGAAPCRPRPCSRRAPPPQARPNTSRQPRERHDRDRGRGEQENESAGEEYERDFLLALHLAHE